MDNSREPGTVLLLDGDDIPVEPLGDDGFLHHLRIMRIAQDFL